MAGKEEENVSTLLTDEITKELYNFPYPPPLFVEEFNEEAIRGVQGFVKRDEDGTWVKRFLTYRNFGKFLVDVYDNWIKVRLPDQLKHIGIEFPDGRLCFEDVKIEEPRFKKNRGPGACKFSTEDMKVEDRMYPWIAKRENKTYAISIYARPTFIFHGGNRKYLTDYYCHIGDIPVMLRSEFCYLSQMSAKEMLSYGEDPDTAVGYFIIEGKKKVVMNYEKIRLNKPLLYRYKNEEFICRTTFENYNGTSIVEVGYTKDKKIDIFLSSLNLYSARKLRHSRKLDKKDKKLNVFHIFRYLTMDYRNGEYESFDTIINKYIFPFVRPENKSKIIAELAFTINNLNSDGEFLDPIDLFMVKLGISEDDEDENGGARDIAAMEINRVLDRDLFPTLNNIDNLVMRNKLKLLNLGAMVARLTEYMAGLRPLDNRDLWSNKRLESAGRAMEQYFRILWGHLLKKALDGVLKQRYQGSKDKEKIKYDQYQPLWLLNNLINYTANIERTSEDFYMVVAKEVVNCIKYDVVTDSFRNAFAKKWQIKGVYSKENVVQELKTDNKIATLSHLLRLDIEGSHHGTSHDIRHVQPDQYGFICAVHTPDGGPCGMVKNMAITCEISKGLSNVKEVKIIEKFTRMRMVNDSWSFYSFKELEKMWGKERDKRIGEIDKDIKVLERVIKKLKGNEKLSKVAELENLKRLKNEEENSVFKKPMIKHAYREGLDGKFYFNGRFLGWCNAKKTRDELYRMKLNRYLLTSECSVSLDMDGNVFLFTDNSRVIRPLLLVNETGDKLVYKELQEKNPNHYFTFEELVILKAATYVDPHEQTYIKLASIESNIDEFFRERDAAVEALKIAKSNYERAKSSADTEKNLTILKLDLEKVEMRYNRIMDKRPYTHCELHPQALLAVSASIIPAPQTNQSARNTFQAGTATQALSIYHPNQRDQFDGKTKLLAYPSNPIFTTEMESVFSIDKTPQGNNVVVAFMSDPMTDEDAFVMSQRAVDLGLFTVIKYTPFTTIVHRQGKHIDSLQRPTAEQLSTAKEIESFHAINDNGLPNINAYLKPGDIVISCFRTDVESGIMVKNHVTLGAMEEGIVHNVSQTKRPDDSIIVRVTLRTVRKPKVGDKYAARNAQKGTVSVIKKTEDMPWTENGIIPDIIVNPHAIPSRMTLSYLIEILTGKVAAMTGERINATPFEKIDLDKFFNILSALGYSRDGTERMYSGTTGELLKIPIFIGPAYFQALRHHVSDKVQSRGKGGATKLSSRQPVEGRSRGGGQI